MKHYIIQVLIALDQLVNAILGGWADETISARAYRLAERNRSAKEWGPWRIIEAAIDLLFLPEDVFLRFRNGFWSQSRHCQRAYNAERKREQYPPEYRI